MRILAIYVNSIFQDIESFLRTEIDLVEDDIGLVLDKYISSFTTYELEPGLYIFKDIFEALYNIIQPEYQGPTNVIDIEFDDITMKTKLAVKPGITAVRLEEVSFFSTILGFNHGWDFKHYNEYLSQEILNLSTTKKVHLKTNVIDGSVVNGLKQSILYSFVLDKPTIIKYFPNQKQFIIKKLKNLYSILLVFTLKMITTKKSILTEKR